MDAPLKSDEKHRGGNRPHGAHTGKQSLSSDRNADQHEQQNDNADNRCFTQYIDPYILFTVNMGGYPEERAVNKIREGVQALPYRQVLYSEVLSHSRHLRKQHVRKQEMDPPAADKKCDTCGKVISNHTGGKANCHTKAVCEVCQLAYGEKNPANHDGGTELRNARAATYTSTGYTGDTYCKGCNTKLSSGTVIPKLSSGAPAPVKPAAPGKTVQSGKTGDAGVALYAGMALLSLTGCAWLRRKGK